MSREVDVEGYDVIVDETLEREVHVALICECENNRNPIVFFETEARPSHLHAHVVKCSGAPTRLWVSGGWEPLETALNFKKFHHYAQGPITTQYCSFTKPRDKDKDWIAQHPDHQHETFTKLTDAVGFRQSRSHAPLVRQAPTSEPIACVVFHYPVLVLEGDLYLAKGNRRTPTLSPVDHLQYRRHIAAPGGESAFQIDIIRERHLPKFVEAVYGEANEIIERLSKKKSLVNGSLRRTLGEARLGITDQQTGRALNP